MSKTQYRVLLAFSLAYFLSFLFRGINIGFQPFLTSEIHLSSVEIGTLTSVYFLGFALAQIPAGVFIDRYGAQRTTAVFMLVAAVGSAIMAIASNSNGSDQVAFLISTLGAALIIGNIVFGALARSCERKGVEVRIFSGLVMALFIVIQAAIILQAPLPDYLLWAAYGAVGGLGTMTYAVLPNYFSPDMMGRVNTTFTLVIFSGVFLVQTSVGKALSLWEAHHGHFPMEAHQSIWFVLIALQVCAAIWYFIPSQRMQAISH